MLTGITFNISDSHGSQNLFSGNIKRNEMKITYKKVPDTELVAGAWLLLTDSSISITRSRKKSNNALLSYKLIFFLQYFPLDKPSAR